MSMLVLENQIKSIICNMTPGTEFLLRDITNNPPSLLGRLLYKDVQNGIIPNVLLIGKVSGVNKYRKI